LNKPFLLRPSGKDYLWGGRRLNDEFAKGINLSPLAETWECSTHPDGPSFVANGEHEGMELVEVIKRHPQYLGTRHEGKDQLPILIKFIDAKEDLSVQVHPTDVYAQKYENGQLGKTELWYILDAAKDAKLVYGFRHDTDEKTVRSAIHDGTLMKHLQQIPVWKDDLFFIEAGTVHAIGAGTLVAEIQENSNLTYRLYDYDRIDKYGQRRALHIEKALQVAHFHSSTEPKQPLRVLKYRQGVAIELLSRCKYFEVYRMIVNTERRQTVHYRADEMGFRVLLCVNGCGVIRYSDTSHEGAVSYEDDVTEVFTFYKGDCIFVPADSVLMSIHGQAQFLDVRG
jgi:mannose-6-phosphate isomerase